MYSFIQYSNIYMRFFVYIGIFTAPLSRPRTNSSFIYIFFYVIYFRIYILWWVPFSQLNSCDMRAGILFFKFLKYLHFFIMWEIKKYARKYHKYSYSICCVNINLFRFSFLSFPPTIDFPDFSNRNISIIIHWTFRFYWSTIGCGTYFRKD